MLYSFSWCILLRGLRLILHQAAKKTSWCRTGEHQDFVFISTDGGQRQQQLSSMAAPQASSSQNFVINSWKEVFNLRDENGSFQSVCTDVTVNYSYSVLSAMSKLFQNKNVWEKVFNVGLPVLAVTAKNRLLKKHKPLLLFCFVVFYFVVWFLSAHTAAWCRTMTEDMLGITKSSETKPTSAEIAHLIKHAQLFCCCYSNIRRTVNLLTVQVHIHIHSSHVD